MHPEKVLELTVNQHGDRMRFELTKYWNDSHIVARASHLYFSEDRPLWKDSIVWNPTLMHRTRIGQTQVAFFCPQCGLRICVPEIVTEESTLENYFLNS